MMVTLALPSCPTGLDTAGYRPPPPPVGKILEWISDATRRSLLLYPTRIPRRTFLFDPRRERGKLAGNFGNSISSIHLFSYVRLSSTIVAFAVAARNSGGALRICVANDTETAIPGTIGFRRSLFGNTETS